MDLGGLLEGLRWLFQGFWAVGVRLWGGAWGGSWRFWGGSWGLLEVSLGRLGGLRSPLGAKAEKEVGAARFLASF